MMTDAQFAILISVVAAAGTAIAASLKWSVSRIVRALDANTSAFTAAERAAGIQAEVLRNVAAEVRHVHDWCDSHTGVTSVPEGIRPKKHATPPKGTTYSSIRGRSSHDEET